jgi:cardiolipin synthase
LGSITGLGLLLGIVHGLGILSAAHAVMNVRISQSAVAWSISLVTFPWLALPLYWTLGDRRFRGYTTAYQQAYQQYQTQVNRVYQELRTYTVQPVAPFQALGKLAARLNEFAFTAGNVTQLLINGEQTYGAMLAAIHQAQDYIFLQTYILQADQTGQDFQQALIQKAQAGVRVYVLYDAIGSQGLSRTYRRTLQRHQIQVVPFASSRGLRNPFQINFRNHRKILIIDGQLAFTGGLNIGDEYLGKNLRLGFWRDTHLQLQGPAVKDLQLSFLKDWYWATRQIPAANWTVVADRHHHEQVFILSTGPADRLPACTLFFHTLIGLAQKRLWIASPYFVPDEPTLAALKAAALRGVDVRILLPGRPDHYLVYLSAYSYYQELKVAGIKLYRYQKGFMHQKTILVDTALAGVGTVNLDNRSFHLNFEAMTFVSQGQLIAAVASMLKNDLADSRLVELASYDHKPFWFKLLVRSARLLAPLQ